MDNTTNSLLNFFFDKSRSFGIKTALTISLFGMFFIVDFGLNFSYNLSVNNKISQLERIQNLKRSYKNESLKFKQIAQLENEIINKKHYSEFLISIFSSQNSKTKSQEQPIENTPVTTSDKSNTLTVSTFWMILSSNYSLIIIWPILIFLPLFPNQKYEKNYFSGWIALNIIWVALISLIGVIAFQIPIINNNPTYNYLLNFTIHTMFIVFIIFLNKKKK